MDHHLQFRETRNDLRSDAAVVVANGDEDPLTVEVGDRCASLSDCEPGIDLFIRGEAHGMEGHD
jgi:hypothetical protein